MEVIKDRLEREYDLDVVVTAPSVEYQVQMSDGTETTIQFANMLPPPHKVAEIREPYCLLEMIVPEEHMGPCMELATQRRGGGSKGSLGFLWCFFSSKHSRRFEKYQTVVP